MVGNTPAARQTNDPAFALVSFASHRFLPYQLPQNGLFFPSLLSSVSLSSVRVDFILSCVLF